MTPNGKRRTRVRFQRRTVGTTNVGGFVEGGWCDLGDRWARLAAARGSESVEAKRAEGLRPFDLWVLADSLTRTIEANDRVLVIATGEALAIRFTGDMNDRNAELLFSVEGGVADSEP